MYTWSASTLVVSQGEIEVETKEKYEFTDLTSLVRDIVEKSKIKFGWVNITSKHTTTAILLNEKENFLLDDFKEVARQLVPVKYFFHDKIERRRKECPELPQNECKNGHAHCLSILLTNSQTIHIISGELNLGDWQRVLFWELDEPKKKRTISFTVMGVGAVS